MEFSTFWIGQGQIDFVDEIPRKGVFVALEELMAGGPRDNFEDPLQLSHLLVRYFILLL